MRLYCNIVFFGYFMDMEERNKNYLFIRFLIKLFMDGFYIVKKRFILFLI